MPTKLNKQKKIISETVKGTQDYQSQHKDHKNLNWDLKEHEIPLPTSNLQRRISLVSYDHNVQILQNKFGMHYRGRY